MLLVAALQRTCGTHVASDRFCIVVGCGVGRAAIHLTAALLCNRPPFLPAAIDTNANGTVERTEFADFIFHLAVAELKSTQAASLSELED